MIRTDFSQAPYSFMDMVLLECRERRYQGFCVSTSRTAHHALSFALFTSQHDVEMGEEKENRRKTERRSARPVSGLYQFDEKSCL